MESLVSGCQRKKTHGANAFLGKGKLKPEDEEMGRPRETRPRCDFTPSLPNKAWAGDITYVWTREGWLYLAVDLDLFSRKVVGWSMDSTLSRDLVAHALKMAMRARQPGTGLV
jgi:transposase InsO family protein